MDKKTLILGLGSEILTDDGIGVKLLKDIQKLNKNSNIEYNTALLGSLELIEIINGFDTVIFIDAIKSPGAIPGDTHVFTMENFRETLHLTNIHDATFTKMIELGKALEYKIPEDIYILAIEVEEFYVFSDQLSDSLRPKYQEILSKAQNLVNILTDKSATKEILEIFNYGILN